MKRFMMAALLATSLAGCVTDQGTPSALPSQIDQTIAKVQSIAVQVCAFVPTAQTVAAILASLGVPGVNVASDVAGDICNAVTKAKAGRGGAPKVAGVRIRGHFVR